MKTVRVVIGANYGDEGKGNVTNYLSKPKSLVVRFNGGAQAGHTVVEGGVRHVFHSFGSGTLKRVPTYFGPEFAIDPIIFFKELEELSSKAPSAKFEIYADPRCPIVTPFDVYVNQLLEIKRGNKRHGSCGMGFGETIRRNKQTKFGYVLQDFVDGKNITEVLSHQFDARLEELELKLEDRTDLANVILMFYDELASFVENVTIAKFEEIEDEFDDIIFEGAQGLCLDQHSPDFPHVTYSSTGLDYVLDLLDPGKHKLEVYYVTRPYLTRHGAGTLKDEYDELLDIVDETNHHNEFQGSLRFAPLDTERMRKDIYADIRKAMEQKFSIKSKLMITCCDQIEDPETKIPEIVEALKMDRCETCWSDAGDWRWVLEVAT